MDKTADLSKEIEILKKQVDAAEWYFKNIKHLPNCQTFCAHGCPVTQANIAHARMVRLRAW